MQIANIKGVKLMMDGVDASRNRGFCFVDFENNDDAAAAFYYMQKPGFSLDGVAAAAEWAQPLEAPVRFATTCDFFVCRKPWPAVVTQTVVAAKCVYVSNLPMDMSDEEIKAVGPLFPRPLVALHGAPTDVVCLSVYLCVARSTSLFVEKSLKSSTLVPCAL
jgi:hypothetical protein